MKLYEQKYIDAIGEDRFISILRNGYYISRTDDGNKVVVFNLDGETMNDKKLNFAFQHFLIKYYTSERYIAECVKYLNMFYADFKKYPYKYVHSPLIENNTLDEIIGNSPSKDAIKNVRNKYYNSKQVGLLYEKKKKTPLTEEEENRYYAYLIRMLDIPIESIKKVIQNEIDIIIKENKLISSINSVRLQFYAQYVSNYAQKVAQKSDVKNVLFIGTNIPQSGGYELNDIICMNKATSYTPTIAGFTEAVCHETRHSLQEHKALEVNSKEAFEMAQHKLYAKYLPYNSYDRNYRYSSVELDAEQYGYFYTSVFFEMHHAEELVEENRKRKEKYFFGRNKYNYMLGKDGKAYPSDFIITHNMDVIISRNPYELDNYPVLKQIYNKDGKRKNLEELLYNKSLETIDNRGCLDSYIYSDIGSGKLNTLDISDDNKFDAVAKVLNSLYRGKVFNVMEYLNDKNPKVSANQINFATLYELDVLDKILKYVNENFDRILKKYNGKVINDTTDFYDFIMGFRDFDISKIKNPRLQNNEKVEGKISKLKDLTNQIIKKYNSYFVLSRLNEIPEEKKNSIITIDGMDMTFYEYFTKIVYPMMDGHQEINVNGHVYYVGNMIRRLNDYVNEQSLEIKIDGKKY